MAPEHGAGRLDHHAAAENHRVRQVAQPGQRLAVPDGEPAKAPNETKAFTVVEAVAFLNARPDA